MSDEKRVPVHYFPPPPNPRFDAEQLELRGFGLCRTGKLEEALAAFRRCHELDPRPRYLFRIGEVLAGLGDVDQGISAFHQAVEMDPQNANVLAELGYKLFKLHRYKESVDAFTRALALSPDFMSDPQSAREREAYRKARVRRFLPEFIRSRL